VIAVDTNALLRLLVGDDPAQAANARRLFDRADAQQQSIWVADTVLVELVWTLGRAYSRDRADIVKALRTLSSHATVVLRSAGAIREATDVLEHGHADFADCLLCVKAQSAGCDEVATFDRGMKGLPAVRLL
jgi:predicted nucleic-acid-binding protein